MDLQNEIESKLKDLDISVKQLRITGSKYAESYTNYRIALAQELLKLKEQCMPVTLCYDVARGKQDIAKLKFNEIKDEAIYLANRESINAIKLEIKILAEQIKKEYSLSEEDNL